MSDKIIRYFASLLAAADDKERQGLLKRANLIAMNEADPEVFEPPVQTLGEYLSKPIEIPPTLVGPDGFIVRGGLIATIGRAGKGKTVMNLNRLLKWAAGAPMFSDWKSKDGETYLAPVAPLRVLVIENEGSAGMFHKQVGLMAHAEDYLTKLERETAFENVMVWGDGGWSGLKLDRERDLNNVRTGVEKFKPDIVFMEPFRGLWQGDENSSTEMANVADSLQGIASDYECAVIISHHERKSGAGDDGEKMSAGRGSTVLEGIVQSMENFESVKDGDFRELSWSKARYCQESLLPVRMEWDSHSWWYKYVALDQVEQEIIYALESNEGDPLTVGEFMEATGESEPKVRKVVKRLVESGRIKRTSSGQGFRYRLPSDSDDGSGGLAM